MKTLTWVTLAHGVAYRCASFSKPVNVYTKICMPPRRRNTQVQNGVHATGPDATGVGDAPCLFPEFIFRPAVRYGGIHTKE